MAVANYICVKVGTRFVGRCRIPWFQEVGLAVGSAVKPCAFGAPLARLRGLTAPPRQVVGHPCSEGRKVPSRPTTGSDQFRQCL